MNEPHSRKVKYDDGAQMTDTHKARASETKSICLPCDTQFVLTRTATAVETNGKPVTARVFVRGHGLRRIGDPQPTAANQAQASGRNTIFLRGSEKKSPRPRSLGQAGTGSYAGVTPLSTRR
jgi:hypothetical protein